MSDIVQTPSIAAPLESTSEVAGYVLEIFTSWQGEGIHHDAKQVFVRLSGCAQACRYCDTKESWRRAPGFRAEARALSREWERHDNPCRPGDVEAVVRRHVESAGDYHSISVTGGEPLDQPDFLLGLLPRLRRFGLPIFLETAGTEPEALAKVLPLVDIVSADIKLPSTPGVRTSWERIEAFLRTAKSPSIDLYTKIVVWDGAPEAELFQVRDLVAAVDPAIPVILQPVTPEAGMTPPAAETLERWRGAFLQKLRRVEVIPQLHKQRGHL